MQRVLALGSNYEPIGTIPWKKAINLIFTNKVFTLAEYDEEIRSPSYSMKSPSVIVFRHSKRRPIGSVRFSRKNVWVRDEGKCQYCSVKVKLDDFTIDHINPKCNGGKTTWENVVTCCYKCNQKKAEKELKDVGFKLAKPARKPTRLPIHGEMSFDYDLENNIHPTWKYWLGKQP